MDIQIEKQTLGGTEYISSESSRGKTTTVFKMDGTVFVQTSHKGVPKAFDDVKKPSNLAIALVQELEA